MAQYLGGRRFTKKKVGLKQPRVFCNVLMGFVPIFGLAFLSAFLASSVFAPINTSNAAETVITANVSYNAYSMTLNAASNVALNISTNRNGVMTVGTSNVEAKTTAPNGYKLYLGMTGANSSTNSLIHSTDSTKTITSSGTFTNPVALSNGTWGYAIPRNTATVATNGFDETYTTLVSGAPTQNTFAAVPTGSPQLIAETDSSNAEFNVVPVYYGVMAGYNTAAGTYSNKILYTAIADTGATDYLYAAPDHATSTSGGETLTLTTTLVIAPIDVNYYVYLLTQSEYDQVTDSQSPVDVSTFTSAEITGCTRASGTDLLQLTCTTPAKAVGDYYLYVDLPDYGLQYDRAFSYTLKPMQNFTAAECSAMSVGDTVTLIDNRDDNEYAIAKWADNNCWMTENLRLGGAQSITLTPSDSNVSSSFILPAVQTSGSDEWSDASNSTNTTHIYAFANSGTTAGYGNLYNWYTATAGTGIGDMQTTDTANPVNATDSICPKGWRLPDGGTSATKSWYALDIALGGNGTNRTDATQRNKFINAPYSFPYSGAYGYGGGLYYQGSNGNWWSRSAWTSAGRAYAFYLDSNGYVSPQSNNNVGVGLAVRCVSE